MSLIRTGKLLLQVLLLLPKRILSMPRKPSRILAALQPFKPTAKKLSRRPQALQPFKSMARKLSRSTKIILSLKLM
jgi:hypothetical protein